jgi:DNA-binding transcriptional LysR family regulator
MMNWDDFDVFCHVVEHGSFTAAAQALERPKSSISAAVARLEAALRARLIERTTRQLRLTEAGETLHHTVGPLFGALREARSDALAQREAVVGTLRIAAPYEFGAHHLGPVACRLMQQHPQLQVQVDVAHEPVNPLERRYDIAFAMLDAGLPDSSLVVRRMFSLERGVFASPLLLQGRGDLDTPGDLRGLPLLCAPGETDWTFTDAEGCIERLPAAPARLTSSNAELRLQAAIAGLGVARITATFCDAAVADGKLVRLLPLHRCAPLRIYALLPGKRLMPAKVRMFLDALGEQAGVAV